MKDNRIFGRDDIPYIGGPLHGMVISMAAFRESSSRDVESDVIVIDGAQEVHRATVPSSNPLLPELICGTHKYLLYGMERRQENNYLMMYVHEGLPTDEAMWIFCALEVARETEEVDRPPTRQGPKKSEGRLMMSYRRSRIVSFDQEG